MVLCYSIEKYVVKRLIFSKLKVFGDIYKENIMKKKALFFLSFAHFMSYGAAGAAADLKITMADVWKALSDQVVSDANKTLIDFYFSHSLTVRSQFLIALMKSSEAEYKSLMNFIKIINEKWNSKTTEEAAEEERLEIEYARPAGKLPVEKKPRIKPGWEFVRVDEIETEFEVMHQTTEDLMALTAGTGLKTRSQISKVCGP